MALLWTEKYKPTKAKDFVDNGQALSQLDQWIASWKKGKPGKKAAFLYGPPGVGKTLSVEILAKEHDFDLISLDASDWRTKDALERIVGSATMQQTLFGRGGRLILLDELEGMSGTQDRGGLSTIIDLAKTAKCPLVLVANDVWSPEFSSLRNSCLVIKFQRIPVGSVVACLRRICDREGIRAEEEALRLVAERARGDLRSAIIDLQALSQNKTILTYDDVSWLGDRDRQEAIFSVLSLVFTADTCFEARRAVDVADVDYEMLFEWIYENAPHQLSDMRDLSDALDALSRADIYLNRVKTLQEWGLLKYAFDQMTASVAMARKRSPRHWVAFKFPERIKAMARMRGERQLRKEVGVRMGARLHMSSDAVVREILPYLRIIFENDADAAARMAKEFDLDEKTVSYLSRRGE